jgi:hypothetical protein
VGIGGASVWSGQRSTMHRALGAWLKDAPPACKILPLRRRLSACGFPPLPSNVPLSSPTPRTRSLPHLSALSSHALAPSYFPHPNLNPNAYQATFPFPFPPHNPASPSPWRINSGVHSPVPPVRWVASLRRRVWAAPRPECRCGRGCPA